MSSKMYADEKIEITLGAYVGLNIIERSHDITYTQERFNNKL